MVQTDRGPGLVSSKQREYLLGQSDIEENSDRERMMRQRIRERIRNAILDFGIIGTELADEDWDRVGKEIRYGEKEGTEAQYKEGIYWAVAFALRFGLLSNEDRETIINNGIVRSDRDVLHANTDIETTSVNTYEPGTVTDKLQNGEKPSAGEITMAFVNGELDEIHKEKLAEVGWKMSGGEATQGAHDWDGW